MIKQITMRSILVSLLFLLLFSSVFLYSQGIPYLRLSARDYQDYCRFCIESSVPLSTHLEKSDSNLFIKIRVSENYRVQKRNVESDYIKSLNWSKGVDYYLVSLELKRSNFLYDSFSTSDPYQFFVDIKWTQEKNSSEPIESNNDPISGIDDPVEKSVSSASASTASQGLKTIVIDPGHGGLETGAKGKFGALEKDITLAISQKLQALIERNLSYRVVMTREQDVDVSLENRAAIANNNRAYVFISVHINGSYRKDARGSETFFLSLNATDEEARRLAYLENNSSEIESKIVGEDEDDIMMILWDMAQTNYIKKSSQLAEYIQSELNALLGTVNRGIKQAPFKVLTGVACPAVLVEIAFISNPQEEQQLTTQRFQENVARAIFRGLSNFLRSYSQN